MEFAENILKAILVQNGLYDDRPKWQGGDRHHSCDDLWDKIKQNNLFSYSDMQILDSLLPGLFKIDVSSDNEHIDCATEMVPGFRYHDMDDFIDYDDAKEKVDLMNQAMNILRHYF